MLPVPFDQGINISRYLDMLKYYKSIVKRLRTAAAADAKQVQRLTDATARHVQPVRVTVMTEDWCGDSACNLPIIEKLFESAGIEARVFHGSDHADLESYYHNLGVDHIPVVSWWDGDGNEIGRWVEQPEAMTPRKDAWKSERPEFMELYARRDTDKDAAKRFATLYRSLLEQMAEWYTEGLWDETIRELIDALKP